MTKKLFFIALIVISVLFVSCGNLTSVDISSVSFNIDAATAAHIASAVSEAGNRAGTDPSASYALKLDIRAVQNNDWDDTLGETPDTDVIPLQDVSPETITAALSGKSYTIKDIPAGVKAAAKMRITLVDTTGKTPDVTVASGTSNTFILKDNMTLSVVIKLTLDEDALPVIAKPYEGLLPLWNYDSNVYYKCNFYLTTLDDLNTRMIGEPDTKFTYFTNRDKYSLVSYCTDANDRLWYTKHDDDGESWLYPVYVREGSDETLVFRDYDNTKFYDIDYDVVTGKIWLYGEGYDSVEDSSFSFLQSFNSSSYPANLNGVAKIHFNAEAVRMGAVVNDTYYYITENGYYWEDTYAIVLHKAATGGSEVTDINSKDILEFIPDAKSADYPDLKTTIVDIAALEDGIFVLFRQQRYETYSPENFDKNWYIDRGGLLWLDPDTLEKKDIVGVTPVTTDPVTGPLIINDGYYKNGGMYTDEDGNKQILTNYIFKHGVAVKDAQTFYAPVKFLAVKPKKLVIADNGVYMYCDSDKLTTKDASRVVTVDLEHFSEPIYTEVSANFGRGTSGSAFCASSFSAFNYASDFYAKGYDSSNGFALPMAKNADLTDEEFAATRIGIYIDMPISGDLN